MAAVGRTPGGMVKALPDETGASRALAPDAGSFKRSNDRAARTREAV